MSCAFSRDILGETATKKASPACSVRFDSTRYETAQAALLKNLACFLKMQLRRRPTKTGHAEDDAAEATSMSTQHDAGSLGQDGHQQLLPTATARQLFAVDDVVMGSRRESMLQRPRPMTVEEAPFGGAWMVGDEGATGGRSRTAVGAVDGQHSQFEDFRRMMEEQRLQIRSLEKKLAESESRRKDTCEAAAYQCEFDDVEAPSSARQMARDEQPWTGSGPEGRGGDDRTIAEEARSQLAALPADEQRPLLNLEMRQFGRAQIEGFYFDARDALKSHQRRAAFKAASEARDIVRFRPRDATRLETFLEAVVRLINHWDLQPGDWGRILVFYLDLAVLRGLRVQQPVPTTFTQVVRYLRQTYPVSGAIEAARIVDFRATIQGTRSVTEFYEELCRYQEDAPDEFTERELTRQFVNNLQPLLRGDIRKEYDRDIRGARLLRLYQAALGAELRARQDKTGKDGPAPRPQGSWYGKPREKAVAVAAVVSGASAQTTTWAPGSCFNCGSTTHRLRQCQGKCDNCRQPGHIFKTCHKKCPKCGQVNHSHRFCRPERVGEHAARQDNDPEVQRQDVTLLMCVPRSALKLPACVILISSATASAISKEAGRLRRLNQRRILVSRMYVSANRRPINVGLDTLAAANVMTRRSAEELGVMDQLRPSNIQFDGVGSSPSLGSVTIQMGIFAGAPLEPTEFEVIEELPHPIELLVGLQWLQDHKADLRLRRSCRETRVSLLPLGEGSEGDDESDCGECAM